MIKKYRKKPVVIEAVQWNGKSCLDAKELCSKNGLPEFYVGARKGQTGLIIPTLEGDHVAKKGDWIIKGVEGEFYPIGNGIFWKTYDEVE